MKDNSTLKSKISSYLTLAGGVTAVVSGANAQVVYTDVNPDQILTGHMSAYSLDLNNDATTDFNLKAIDTMFNYIVTAYSYNYLVQGAAILENDLSNSWIAGNGAYPLNLVQGENIGNSGAFDNYGPSNGWGFAEPFGFAINYSLVYNGVALYQYTSTIGNFTAGQEGFVGLKFKIGANTHYGWARVELKAGYDTLIIKDYAYQATPDSSILAGDTSSGFVGIQELENDVLISNYNNNVQIKLKGELKNAQLNITNISGQQILSKELNSEVEMISMDEFAAGIYLATVFSDKGTITKRVYIR